MTVKLLVDMREYILTNREQHIIQKLLETGERIEGFSMLKNRAKKNLPRLREDLELIDKFLKITRVRETCKKIQQGAESQE